jgi:cell division protease FtsH
MGGTSKTVLFWLGILVSAFLLWQAVKANPANQNTPEISYSRFLAQVADGQVTKVTIAGSVVRGYDAKGGSFRAVVPPNQSAMVEALQQHGVDVWFRETSEQGWPTWVLNLAPLILLAALWFFMIRQMQTRGNRLRATGQTPGPPPESPPRFGS